MNDLTVSLEEIGELQNFLASIEHEYQRNIAEMANEAGEKWIKERTK